MTMNGAVLPILAGYIVAAEEQGVKPGAIVRHHPERHPQRVHGAEHLYLSAQAVDEDHRRHLQLHGAEHAEIQLDLDSGYHIQEAGANQAIELAFTLADGMEYVRTGVASAWMWTPSPGVMSSSGQWA